jgi:hypothetical protein
VVGRRIHFEAFPEPIAKLDRKKKKKQKVINVLRHIRAKI